MNTKNIRLRAATVIVGFMLLLGVAFAGTQVVASTDAQAWPTPSTNVIGGACDAEGHRAPVTATTTNLETGNVRSPATISNVVVTPNYPFTTFAPQPLPNTGTSQASTNITVPDNFSGTLTITYKMNWNGPDGNDSRDGSGTIHVYICTGPTTTPSTEGTTTTTTQPVTTTTEQTTTTPSTEASTTTTQPVTTTSEATTTSTEATTSTTQPVTTVTTAPTTTSTEGTTTSTEGTTSTTQPVTSTTKGDTTTSGQDTTTSICKGNSPTTDVNGNCHITPTMAPGSPSNPTPPATTNGALPTTGQDSLTWLIRGLAITFVGLLLWLASTYLPARKTV